MRDEYDVLILGGGLCGLAAATQLGDASLVVERESSPGGLVRSLQLGEWWFDHVIHLLYFCDPETERIIKGLLAKNLQPCPPRAWVETPDGITRYPFQMHLGSLPHEVIVRCVEEYARQALTRSEKPGPSHFAAALEYSFGRGICDAFLFPYNRKVWRRPLERLSASGFPWTIPRADFADILRGALDPERIYESYNANGWYPRPKLNAKVRGMEVVSRALAECAEHVLLDSEVTGLNLESSLATVRSGGESRVVRFGRCLSTIPLPALLRIVEDLPAEEMSTASKLPSNRVVMVYVALRGPQVDRGTWRYYSDESLCFTRLVFMNAFDAYAAPPDGWGLMAEVPEPSEDPSGDLEALTARVLEDARRVGAVTERDRIEATACRVYDPGYVVFEDGVEDTVLRLGKWLGANGVTILGRFGRWEYSSMAQVMRDGFSWGRSIADDLGHVAPDFLRWKGSGPGAIC